jgi:hypothetical protein
MTTIEKVIYGIINDKNLLNDLAMSNLGSWQNDSFSHEFGTQKYEDYFLYEGGFSFNFPISLFPPTVDSEKVDLVEDEDFFYDTIIDAVVPSYIMDACQPENVDGKPKFLMMSKIKDGVMYIESELQDDTKFTAPDYY